MKLVVWDRSPLVTPIIMAFGLVRIASPGGFSFAALADVVIAPV